MATELLPQSFWFRLAVPCPKVVGMPRETAQSGLLNLPDSSRLPDLGPMEGGKASWTRVKVGWNPQGIGVTIQADGRRAAAASAGQMPDGFANINIWIDTRDTRNVSRATRFCHRFTAKLSLRRGKEILVEAAQRPIARAIADAPICRPEAILTRAELVQGGWTLELFIPAQALQGFDPETNRRLGFAFQVNDLDQDSVSFPVGREFPVGENPGLWSTLELSD